MVQQDLRLARCPKIEKRNEFHILNLCEVHINTIKSRAHKYIGIFTNQEADDIFGARQQQQQQQQRRQVSFLQKHLIRSEQFSLLFQEEMFMTHDTETKNVSLFEM